MKNIYRWIIQNTAYIIVVILVLCFVAMIVNPVWADDDRGDVTQSNDMNNQTAGDVTGGNMSTGSNRALALSNGLGDVDIRDCLGSTQWSTPLFSKQKLTPNWGCLAEFYLSAGKYELAAIAMCNTEIRNEFTSEDECRSAHDFAPVYEAAVIVEEDYEWRDEQIAMQADYDQRIDHLEQLVQRQPTRQVTREVVQQPFLSDEKRAKLQALLDEDEE